MRARERMRVRVPVSRMFVCCIIYSFMCINYSCIYHACIPHHTPTHTHTPTQLSGTDHGVLCVYFELLNDCYAKLGQSQQIVSRTAHYLDLFLKFTRSLSLSLSLSSSVGESEHGGADTARAYENPPCHRFQASHAYRGLCLCMCVPVWWGVARVYLFVRRLNFYAATCTCLLLLQCPFSPTLHSLSSPTSRQYALATTHTHRLIFIHNSIHLLSPTHTHTH